MQRMGIKRDYPSHLARIIFMKKYPSISKRLHMFWRAFSYLENQENEEEDVDEFLLVEEEDDIDYMTESEDEE